MGVSRYLQKDLARLAPISTVQSTLPAKPAAQAIAAKRGVGTPSVAVRTEQLVIPNIRREAVTVFSHLIITEDGAFERPLGWPATGTYPGSAYVLDTTAQYYEQKRVHYILWETYNQTVNGDGETVISNLELTEEHYFIPFGSPYEADTDGWGSGLYSYSSKWAPPLYMVSNPAAIHPEIETAITNLAAMGVLNG